MYQTAKLQKLLTEAFMVAPSFLGELAEDHWYAQFRHIMAEFDRHFGPEGNVERLAFGKDDNYFYYAWMLEGRVVVGSVTYTERQAGDGAFLSLEVLPQTAAKSEGVAWVTQRSDSLARPGRPPAKPTGFIDRLLAGKL